MYKCDKLIEEIHAASLEAGEDSPPTGTDASDTNDKIGSCEAPVAVDKKTRNSTIKRYHDAGLSVIPIKADATKGPATAWKPYQSRKATPTELKDWFSTESDIGVAVVGGAVSGNLEILDFDEPGLYEQFNEVAVNTGLGEFLSTIPLAKTPSGGMHLYYRCEETVPGNTKLASRNKTTLIETRGEGGYAIVPPSAAACHPDGLPYEMLRGSLADLPVLTKHDRKRLMSIACSFNEDVQLVSDGNMGSSHSLLTSSSDITGTRPGDDYNNRTNIEDVIKPHGWTLKYRKGDVGCWQRPGKTGPGISATTNIGGSKLLYVFSSNAHPFEEGRGYTPFTAYAFLNHDGDFSAAARELARKGFGECGDYVEWAETEGASESWPGITPLAVDDKPEFPIEALPDNLRGIVSEVSQVVQVPSDLPALLALATVAAAAAPSCEVKVGETHNESLNLYTCVVLPPGDRKSQVVKEVVAPLRKVEKERGEAAKATVQAAKSLRQTDEKRLQNLQQRLASGKEADAEETLRKDVEYLSSHMTEVPAMPRLLVDDATPEKLALLMSEQKGVIAHFNAEGGIFTAFSGKMYNNTSNLDLFLKAHAAEECRVDRMSREPLHIEKATLTVGIAVQPEVLRGVISDKEMLGRGLLQRFLWAIPQSQVGTRCYQSFGIDEYARDEYARAIRHIAGLKPPVTSSEGERHQLRLAGEALEEWGRFHDAIEIRLGVGKDMAGISGWGSKLAGAVARIAGLIHLLRNTDDDWPWDTLISKEAVQDAIQIGCYLIPHAKAAFGDKAYHPDTALACRILPWVGTQLDAGFSLRDCERRFTLPAEEATAALKILCEHGYIRKAAVTSCKRSGRPASQAYEVNPMLQDE